MLLVADDDYYARKIDETQAVIRDMIADLAELPNTQTDNMVKVKTLLDLIGVATAELAFIRNEMKIATKLKYKEAK